jgi:hypothetical protein
MRGHTLGTPFSTLGRVPHEVTPVPLSVIPGPTWWPPGVVPSSAPLFLLDSDDELPTRPLSQVDQLPVSTTAYLAYTASRLRAMAQGFDDEGLPGYASELRFLAAGMESELPPDLGTPA